MFEKVANFLQSYKFALSRSVIMIFYYIKDTFFNYILHPLIITLKLNFS